MSFNVGGKGRGQEKEEAKNRKGGEDGRKKWCYAIIELG